MHKSITAIFTYLGAKSTVFYLSPRCQWKKNKNQSDVSMCCKHLKKKKNTTTTQNQQETFVVVFRLDAVWNAEGQDVSASLWRNKTKIRKKKKKKSTTVVCRSACLFFHHILIIKAADCAGLISAGNCWAFSHDCRNLEPDAFTPICWHQLQDEMHKHKVAITL